MALPRLIAAGLVAAAWASATMAAPPPKDQPKDVDVVICLDVSGSMNGLIESARIKLWDVVNELARMKPTPNLRVGLYTYGRADHADAGYVFKEVDLTTDLDEVYKKLNVRPPVGGTEYCGRVTKRALQDQKWSTDKNALRIIFVCGNEPANQDKEVLLPDAAKLAKEMKVIVNTIYCGQDKHPEAAGWKDYAASAGGKYANIDMNRAAAEVTIATPFDKDLVSENEKLNKTYVAYGKDGAEKKTNQLAQDQNAAAAGAAPPGGVTNAANLGRIDAKAGALYRNDTWDIIDRMKEDPKFDWKKLKEEELCEEFRKVKPEERDAFLKQKSEERETVRKKIGELSAGRQKFIDEERKKQPKSDAEKALDEALKEIIRAQAAAVGFEAPVKK
jgi:hypothetical protein